MNSIDYQMIYNLLADVLPDSWDKVVFRAEYREGSYTMKYYVKESSGKYIDCFDLPDINENGIIRAFIDIDKVIFPVRKDLSKKELWSVMTCCISSDGSISTGFLYDDIEKDYQAFILAWKEKYLSH